MKTHAPKSTSSALQPQKGNQPFFQKEGEGAFFSQNKVQPKAGNEYSTTSSFFGRKNSSTPFFTPSSLQTKLTVGQPGDRYEQEADAVANEVLQKSERPGTVQEGIQNADVSPLLSIKSTSLIRNKKSLHKAPANFLSMAVQPTSSQRRDERRIRNRLPQAITLLQSSKSHLRTAGQMELIDAMLDSFNRLVPNSVRVLDVNGVPLNSVRPVRLFYIFKEGRTSVGMPFEYRIYLDLSHESGGVADGRFRPMGNWGGRIILYIPQLRMVSSDLIAELLVHEAVHMLSHLQRSVEARQGSRAAQLVPGNQASQILDTSALANHKRAFRGHFSNVLTFLNRQPHRRTSFNSLPSTILDNWIRSVVEETIAYVFQDRTRAAMDRQQNVQSGGPQVYIATSFQPMRFLRNYLTEHWLNDADDQAAMATSGGNVLLQAMTSDMIALHQAVETQVGLHP